MQQMEELEESLIAALSESGLTRGYGPKESGRATARRVALGKRRGGGRVPWKGRGAELNISCHSMSTEAGKVPGGLGRGPRPQLAR